MKKIIHFIIDLFLFIGVSIFSLIKYKKIAGGKEWLYPKRVKSLLLANGPSLNDDIDKILEKRPDSVVYVLNYFAATKLFKEIKPEYYVLTDRIYWSNNSSKAFQEDNKKLFHYLDQVDWNMNLICPNKGYKYIKNRLSNNRNIRVVKVNSANIEFKNEKINLFSLNLNITTPHFINGFIMVLWHALYRRKLDIEIYGADFSLFKDYYVNQETNNFYSSASHFYQSTEAQKDPSYKYPDEPRKMIHTRFFQVWSSFYQMYLLSKIAKKRKIEIVNYSSNSYLDCFKRPKKNP
tara:strand:+ start:69 stop:944 length:876 start_codon:yes stop_codon:yes gene_type:complete